MFAADKPLPRAPIREDDSPPPLPPRHQSLKVTTPNAFSMGSALLKTRTEFFKQKSPPLPTVVKPEPQPTKHTIGKTSAYTKPTPQMPPGKPTVVIPKLPPKPYSQKQQGSGRGDRKIATIAPTVVKPSLSLEDVRATGASVMKLKSQLGLFGEVGNKISRNPPTIVRPQTSPERPQHPRTFGDMRSQLGAMPTRPAPSLPTIIKPQIPTKEQATMAVNAAVTVNRIKQQLEQSQREQQPTVVRPSVTVTHQHETDSREHTSAVASHVRSLRSQLEGKLHFGSPPSHPTTVIRPDTDADSDKRASDWNQNTVQSDYRTSDHHSSNFVQLQQSRRGFSPERPPPPKFEADRTRSNSLSPTSRESSGYGTMVVWGSAAHKTSAPSRPPPPRKSPSPSPSKETQHTGDEPYAEVLHEFQGSHFDELWAHAGDIILLKKEVDNDWAYGCNPRTGKFGIIPLSFLEVKIPFTSYNKSSTPHAARAPGIGALAASLSHKPHSSTTEINYGPRCLALFEFSTGQDGDLNMKKGEVVRILKCLNDDWLEGESSGGRRGVFPTNYVQIVEGLPTPTVPEPEPQTKQTRTESRVTLYDYDSPNPEDLCFKTGETVEILGKINDDWLYGRNLRTGHEGIFPSNFIPDCPSNLPTYEIPPQASGISLSASVPLDLNTHTGGIQYPSGASSAVDAGVSGLVGKTVVALYDYRGDDPRDLWFEAGDRVLVTGEEGPDWLKGHVLLDLVNRRTLPDGIFPRNFVSE